MELKINLNKFKDEKIKKQDIIQYEQVINYHNSNFMKISFKYNIDIFLPDFTQFKNEFIISMDLIHGVREKTSSKLKKNGFTNLYALLQNKKFKMESENLLKTLNASNNSEILQILSKRFPSSHKLFFLFLHKFKKEDILFLDIETKSLTPETSIILIGCGYFKNNYFTIEQFLILNDFSEYSILKEFLKILTNKKVFITFNGKSFDIPFIENRLGYYNIYKDLSSFYNIDLFHFSKKIFNTIGNSFKLKDLEREILNKYREKDISGEDVVNLYYKYLKTQNNKFLKPIIYHNKEDILSLVSLFNKVCKKWIK